MKRRVIARHHVAAIMDQPGQIIPVRADRAVYQSLMRWPGGKMYVVRVVVGLGADPPTILTVYRTSKIAKYWGKEP